MRRAEVLATALGEVLTLALGAALGLGAPRAELW